MLLILLGTVSLILLYRFVIGSYRFYVKSVACLSYSSIFFYRAVVLILF